MPKVSDKISDEQLERLDLMASGREMTWDLSDNDCEAIASALRELRELRRMNEWVSVTPETTDSGLARDLAGYVLNVIAKYLKLDGEEIDMDNEVYAMEQTIAQFRKDFELPPSPEEAKND